MYIIGLTGGIAMGKTTAMKALKKLGAAVWDADEAARDVCKPGEPGYKAVRDVFGKRFFRADGELDRRLLGEYIFADPERVTQLNQVLHPFILEHMKRRLAVFEKDGAKVAVVEAPLLFESGVDRVCDEVWTLTCGEDEQIRRIMTRDGLTLDEAMDRIDSQMPDSLRRSRSRRVIDTSGSVEDTARAIQNYYLEIAEEQA